MIRKELRFFGFVQGVGFRYRAQYAASACGVTGWVKNEWDGSVYMEVQGSEEQIQRMLHMLTSGSFIRVDRMEERRLAVEESESGFAIH